MSKIFVYTLMLNAIMCTNLVKSNLIDFFYLVTNPETLKEAVEVAQTDCNEYIEDWLNSHHDDEIHWHIKQYLQKIPHNQNDWITYVMHSAQECIKTYQDANLQDCTKVGISKLTTNIAFLEKIKTLRKNTVSDKTVQKAEIILKTSKKALAYLQMELQKQKQRNVQEELQKIQHEINTIKEATRQTLDACARRDVYINVNDIMQQLQITNHDTITVFLNLYAEYRNCINNLENATSSSCKELVISKTNYSIMFLQAVQNYKTQNLPLKKPTLEKVATSLAVLKKALADFEKEVENENAD